jgi:ABC-2 type transport system ATP-binding protein
MTGSDSPRPGLAIEAVALTKEYVAGARAVDEIDLRVRYGSVYCLLGRNGAGKSTTIRMLTTLLPPTAGEASVAGVSIRRPMEVRPSIGVALQDVAMDPAMSAIEHLDLAMRLAGVPRKEMPDRRDDMIERFGLSSFAGRPTGDLSGGMRRRADIALAVVNEPVVLFLDEPSTGLDIEGRDEVWKVIGDLRAEGRTVLLSTHDMDEAVALSDEVGIMKDGRIVLEGDPEELTGGTGGKGLREVFLESTR